MFEEDGLCLSLQFIVCLPVYISAHTQALLWNPTVTQSLRAPNWCTGTEPGHKHAALCPPPPVPPPPPPPSSPFPSSVLPYPNSAKVTEEFCSRWISRPSTHRAIFSPGNLEHVGHRKDFLLTRGNHGNWHWPQGPVSRYLNALNHTPPPRSRRRSSEEGGVGVQRATWLFSGRPCDWWRRNSAAFLVRCCGWMLTSVWGCSREPPLGREG